MPAYPEEDRLLEVATSPGGLPFRVYIDPASLVMGDDQVARYTVVIISSSGVWNVSHLDASSYIFQHTMDNDQTMDYSFGFARTSANRSSFTSWPSAINWRYLMKSIVSSPVILRVLNAVKPK